MAGRAGWRSRALASMVLAALVGLIGLSACSSSEGGAGTTSTSAAASTSRPADHRPADQRPADVPADPSRGCGKAPDVPVLGTSRPGDVARTFTSGGNERVYRLGVPDTYDPDVAAPLVVNLHGSGSNALQASAYGDVPRQAAKRGMITVAPEAIGGKWELGGKGDDGDFIVGLVDDLGSRYCIDRNRVHIIGMSLGAWKAAATACANGDRFASIALVTVEVFPGRCRPMPVVAFHGRADRTVPYGEGGTVTVTGTRNAGLPGARHNIAAWARNGGCDPTPTTSRIGTSVEHRTYHGCDPGVGVELYSIDGGGHTWPGADIDLGPASETTHDIDATTIALDWFEAHPRRP